MRGFGFFWLHIRGPAKWLNEKARQLLDPWHCFPVSFFYLTTLMQHLPMSSPGSLHLTAWSKQPRAEICLLVRESFVVPSFVVLARAYMALSLDKGLSRTIPGLSWVFHGTFMLFRWAFNDALYSWCFHGAFIRLRRGFHVAFVGFTWTYFRGGMDDLMESMMADLVKVVIDKNFAHKRS